MDQNNPNNSGGTSGLGSTGTGSSTGYGSTAGGPTSGGYGSGSANFGPLGGSSPAEGDAAGAPVPGTVGKGSELCPHCGQSVAGRGGLEQFLGRLGITDDMVNNLKTQWDNVDIDEYLNTAREYLRDSSNKASRFAKENPGKVAAGVAVLALGAGLLYNAVRDKAGLEVEFTPEYDRDRK
jgi:hypothetical protein